MMEPDPSRDDFSKIKKITRPIAQGMYDLGILRYADLAGQNPKKLAARLRARNVAFVSEQRIERENWLGQARELADCSDPLAPSGEGHPLEEALPEVRQPERAALADDSDPCRQPSRPGWQELADFFVSFGEEVAASGEHTLKTRVHFSQADRDMAWNGIVDGEELVRWMISQAGLPPAEAPAAQPAALPEQEKPEGKFVLPPAIEALLEKHFNEAPTPLAIRNLWVSHTRQAGSGQRMVRVEADVDAPPEGVALAAPTPFMTGIYLVDTHTGEANVFYETGAVTLSQYDLPYAFQYDFPVPPPGSYQLYLKVTSAEHAPTFKQGPLVRVEG